MCCLVAAITFFSSICIFVQHQKQAHNFFPLLVQMYFLLLVLSKWFVKELVVLVVVQAYTMIRGR